MIACNLACADSTLGFLIFYLEYVFNFVLNSGMLAPLKIKNVILLVKHV